MITYAKVLELFEYKDGELYWKISTGRSKVGKKAGCLDGDGYITIGFNNRDYKAHQLIFLIEKGYIPKEIDHINGIKNDNCIENLRDVSTSQNQQNSKISKNNTSGYKNVTWDSWAKKWRVQINTCGKNKYIGIFENLELADLVAQEARNKYHGEFACHN